MSNSDPAAPVAGAQEAGTDGLDRIRALEARTAAYPDLIERARKALHRACQGKLHMCIPVQDDDDDVILSVVIGALESTRATVSAQAEEIRDLEAEREEAKQLYMAMLEDMNGLRRQLREHDDEKIPQSRAWWRAIAQKLGRECETLQKQVDEAYETIHDLARGAPHVAG